MTYLLSSKAYEPILSDSILLAGLSMKKAALECQIKIAERIGNQDIFVAVVYHVEWNRRFRWTPALCLRRGDALFHVFYHAGWICRECGCNNGAMLIPMAEADPVFYKRREQECWNFPDEFRKIPCKNCGKVLQNHLIRVETH